MAKASQQFKVIVNAKTDDFATKVFSKSDHPKTLKENIKLLHWFKAKLMKMSFD